MAPLIQTYREVRKQFGEFSNHVDNLDKNYTNMAKEILDSNGNIKSMYDGAKVIGYTRTGSPIFDTSALSDDMKKYLSDHTLDTNYSSKSKPAGAVIIAKNVQPEEYHQFFAYNTNLPDETKAKLRALNTEDIEKVFGKNADMAFDPGAEEVILTVKADPKEAKALNLDPVSSYELKIPYSRIRSNPTILSRPAKYLEDNTVKAYDVNALGNLLNNPTTTVHSPKELKALGMTYTVHGGNDSNHKYGLYVKGTFLDPATGKDVKFDHFQEGNPGDETLIHNVESWLNDAQHQYQTMRIQHDTSMDKNGVDLQDYDAFVNSIQI